MIFTENKLQKSITALILVYSLKIFQDLGAVYYIIRCSLINQYLCRIMSEVPVAADDFYELASSLEASTETGNVTMDVEMDEAILDADDEDEEIQILDPPAPPSAQTDDNTALDLSTPSEKSKVNELNKSYDPTECASSNYASSRTGETVKTAETGETFKTSYSKYGTRENREHLNSQNSTYNTKLFDDDTGKPILGSAYLQCKAARAASLFQHEVTNVDISEESGKADTTSIFPVQAELHGRY